ncbi:hypothetical protein [Bradyrhizobium sp. AZCC 1708]|uniref:hypothetical protein n=1 Tax=Bradyrhizobium sp. AZCC 1708 TaxID=3117015 RepID=UPI002FF30B29
MTIASEVSRSGPYTGNGVTTIFNYGFRILDEDHLKVIRTQGGVETVLVIDTDYIVSDVGEAGGGQVALTIAPTAAQTITILRNVPFTQETDLENQGPYFAETIEASLDLSVMRDQQIEERLSRTIMVPASGAGDYDPDQLINDVLNVRSNREAAEAARDEAVAAAETFVQPNKIVLALLTIATLDLTGATSVLAYGRSVLGDAPPLLLVRSAADPAGVPASLKIQSTDGAYWYPPTTQKLYAEHAGGVSGATAAVTTTAIQNVVDYAKICYLRQGGAYLIKQCLVFDGNDEGLISDGRSTITMQTGAGEFDNATLWAITGDVTNAVGMLFTANRPKLHGVAMTMQASGSLRTCIPVAFRGCDEMDVRWFEASGFQTINKGAFMIDSCTGEVRDAYIHDITSNYTSLASIQMSGFYIDDVRIASVNSKVRIVRPRIVNITQGQASITAYNYQTDGITITGGAGVGNGSVTVVDAYIENVAEAIDVHQTGVRIVTPVIKNAIVCAFKFVHDVGSMQVINPHVENTGGSVFLCAGTTTANIGPFDIDVYGGYYTGIGNLTTTGPTSFTKAFISTDGASAPPEKQPRRIRWHAPRIDCGANITHILKMDNGYGFQINEAEIVGAPTVALADVAVGSRTGTRFTLAEASIVRAAQTSNVTLGAGTTALAMGTEIEDSNGEFSGGVFTCKRPNMRVGFRLQLRSGNLGASKYMTALVVAGGTIRAEQFTKNYAASAGEERATAVGEAVLQIGDTLSGQVNTDDAAATFTGTGEERYTSLHVWEIR